MYFSPFIMILINFIMSFIILIRGLTNCIVSLSDGIGIMLLIKQYLTDLIITINFGKNHKNAIRNASSLNSIG